MTISLSPAAPAQPAAFPPAPTNRSGTSLANLLASIGNDTLEQGTRALNLIAPGRVLRAAPQLLTFAGTLLASLGNAQARALQPEQDAQISRAPAALDGRIITDLARCVHKANAPGLPQDRLTAYCLGRVASRLCQSSDDAHCRTTLERSLESSRADASTAPPLNAADIGAANASIQQHFRQSHGYATAMRDLRSELALMSDVSEGRDGAEVSMQRLRDQLRASDGWEDFKQRANDVGPRLSVAYKAAVKHVYRLQPQWLDGPGRDALRALADERYPAASATHINDDQVRHLVAELAYHLNHPALAVVV